MRGIWLWLAACVVGLLVLIGIVAAIGNADDSNKTVPAADWADRACGGVATWRGEMEAIVESIRTPTSVGQASEEPQSETPQGRTGLVRTGLEQATRATQTLVLAFENAGTPGTPNGAESKQRLSSWAGQAVQDLEAAENSLDNEAETLEESINQFTTATRALASTLTGGVKTFADIAAGDPELAKAFQDSTTCQQLREEQSSS
jgi:hypothetical protein